MKKYLFSVLLAVLASPSFSQNPSNFKEGFDVLLAPRETVQISYDASKRTWEINGYFLCIDILYK